MLNSKMSIQKKIIYTLKICTRYAQLTSLLLKIERPPEWRFLILDANNAFATKIIITTMFSEARRKHEVSKKRKLHESNFSEERMLQGKIFNPLKKGINQHEISI